MKLEHTVTPQESGKKLYHVLRGGMRLSAGMLRRLKWNGGLFVDGEPRFTDYIVGEGQLVTAELGLVEPQTDIPPEDGEVDILFEDESLIALAKPAGMIVHPSRSRFTGTLANRLMGYLASKGETPVCHAVNRIDRDTSGIVLFAKNSYMKNLASGALKSAEKVYYAVVLGRVEPPRGTIDLPIIRLREGDMYRAVSPEGQRAVTHYERIGVTLRQGRECSLLRLVLETGRTHQIRVHLSHLGHPLLGDTLYKTPVSEELSAALGLTGQLLHAGRLSFEHPVTGLRIELCCPVRAEMRPFFEGEIF